MLQEILHTTKEVVDTAEFVTINHQALVQICEGLDSKDFQRLNVGSLKKSFTLEQKVGLLGAINSINFSYWPNIGTPEWEFKIGSRTYKDAFGLLKAFEKSMGDGTPITDAHFLANLRREQLAEILKGNVEIPMLSQRVRCLQETGQVLLDEFDGNFMNVLEEANKSAVHFVNLLFYFFPTFNDQSKLDGKAVHFHKRAQLNAKMVFGSLSGKGFADFNDLDKLTILADYIVPQVLRGMGILTYAESLAKRVDSKQEIPSGSKEEIEIRSASIWAGEYMKEALRPKIPGIKSVDLDSFLWLKGRDRNLKLQPFHRTRTIAY